jgi:hypothetical protein
MSTNTETLSHSLFAEDSFTRLLPCVRDGCFFEGCGEQLGHILGCAGGCNVGKVENSCFCRPDRTAVATSHLSTCIKANCKVGDYRPDLTSAIDLYISYCEEHRPEYPSLPPTTAVITVDGEETTADATFAGATKTVYVQPTQTGSGRRETERPIFKWYLVALMLVIIEIRGHA